MQFLILVLLVVPAARGDEIVLLDGRRESVDRAVLKGDFVMVKFARGLRRIPRRQVVKILHAGGREEVLERKLVERPLTQMEERLLKAMETAEPSSLRQIEEQLADGSSRALLEALKTSSSNSAGKTRVRAAEVMMMMCVKEAFEAALEVLRNDPEDTVREQLVSALFRILGALEVHGWHKQIIPLLEDTKRAVRTTAALALGQIGVAKATPVLEKEALRSRDHHVRESAAEVLAGLGNDAGVPILIRMLRRRTHPAAAGGAADATEKSLHDRLLIEEKVRVCGLLERLKSRKARSALKAAARSKNPELAAAAARALQAIEAKG